MNILELQNYREMHRDIERNRKFLIFLLEGDNFEEYRKYLKAYYKEKFKLRLRKKKSNF